MTPAEIIEAIQGVRLEWGMTCPCTCEDCDLLYQRLSAIEEAIASTSKPPASSAEQT